jgi:hypothetical protein
MPYLQTGSIKVDPRSFLTHKTLNGEENRISDSRSTIGWVKQYYLS